MTEIKYPLLPRTVLQGGTYSKESPFMVTESRTGKPYFKRKPINAPTYRDVTFRFKGDEAIIFQSWFRNTLNNGFLPFLMQLKTEWGLQKIECRFLPNSLLNASKESNVWTYTATLMIPNYSVPSYVPPDIAEFPEYFTEDARNWLDIIVNTQLNKV